MSTKGYSQTNPRSLANLIPGARAGSAGLMTPAQRDKAVILFDAWYDSMDLPQACIVAKIPLKTVLDWVDNYRWFGKRFIAMKQWMAEIAESEAHRRAVHGWDEPVFFKDQVIGQVRKFDNKLLVELLRRYKPKEWAPKWQQLDGHGNPANPVGNVTNVILVNPQMQNMADFEALCIESARIQQENKQRFIENDPNKRTD